MANPLARVAMNNQVKKDQKDIGTNREMVKAENITSHEEKIISEIIHGEKKMESKGTNATMVTLDEVARKLKGNR